MCSPGDSPCACRSISRTVYPSRCRNLARGTMLRRSLRRPWTSRTPALAPLPATNQPCTSRPVGLGKVTVRAGRSAGGGPTDPFAGRISAWPATSDAAKTTVRTTPPATSTRRQRTRRQRSRRTATDATHRDGVIVRSYGDDGQQRNDAMSWIPQQQQRRWPPTIGNFRVTPTEHPYSGLLFTRHGACLSEWLPPRPHHAEGVEHRACLSPLGMVSKPFPRHRNTAGRRPEPWRAGACWTKIRAALPVPFPPSPPDAEKRGSETEKQQVTRGARWGSNPQPAE
jgi:hypothetical protein